MKTPQGARGGVITGWGIAVPDKVVTNEDLSARMREEHPSLAGPAARLAELWRDLDAVLARLTAEGEQVIVAGDGLADRARTVAERTGPTS